MSYPPVLLPTAMRLTRCPLATALSFEISAAVPYVRATGEKRKAEALAPPMATVRASHLLVKHK